MFGVGENVKSVSWSPSVFFVCVWMEPFLKGYMQLCYSKLIVMLGTWYDASEKCW